MLSKLKLHSFAASTAAIALMLAAAIPAVIIYNQANVSLGRIADRLSGAVAKFAKMRVYGEAQMRPAFDAKPAAAHVTQGLTNGGLDPR